MPVGRIEPIVNLPQSVCRPAVRQVPEGIVGGSGRGRTVEDVTAGSGAAQAGLQPGTSAVVVEGESYQLGGDIIVGGDGKPVSTLEGPRTLIVQKKRSDTLSWEI